MQEDRINIGRSHNNDVVINDQSVSGFHAQLLANQNGTYMLNDAGSSNGTYIMRQGRAHRITEPEQVWLEEEVALGNTRITISQLLSKASPPGLNQNKSFVQSNTLGRESILQEDRINIGRSHNNDVVINDQSVSGFHAQLLANQNGTYMLNDAGSSNGTYIMRQGRAHRITEPEQVWLEDEVAFGNTRIKFSQLLSKASPPVLNQNEGSTQNNTFGIVALVLGILSILLSFSCGLIGLFGGVAAGIFGILGAFSSQRYATAGLILGVIGIIVGLLMTLIFSALIFWPFFLDPTDLLYRFIFDFPIFEPSF